MLGELRLAVRSLRRSPGFAAAAIVTLALGIGANVAVFSVVNAMLLRAIPSVADPASLVAIYRAQKEQVFDNLSYPDYLDYRDRSRSFAGLAAHSAVAVMFDRGSGAERIHADMVTGNYFGVLGVKAALGRLIDPGDGDSVAVISYGLWKSEFGGDAGVVGARIGVNGHAFTVVGVASDGFRGTATDDRYDLWVPLSATPVANPRLSAGILQDRSAGWIWIFGRLKARVGMAQASAETRTIAAQLARAYPVSNQDRSVDLASGIGLYPDDRAEISGLLGLLSAAVGVLLLIACANVAGLFLVRAARRSREMAVRLAMGAGRGRLMRQMTVEGLVLAVMAGGIGLLISGWATAAVIAASESGSPWRLVDFSVDGRVLVFTLGCCVCVAVLFALAPVVQSSRMDLAGALKSGSAGAGYSKTRLRAALVAGQVALSFCLLSASAVLLRDLRRIVGADPGFETRKVAMMSIDLNTLAYSREKNWEIERRVVERVSQVPGVVSATLAATVPPDDFSGREPIFYPGQEPAPELLHGRSWAYGLWVDVDSVGPGYFSTLGIPLVAGRDFSDRDRAGAPGVVIVSAKLARAMWPNESGVGKKIAWPDWNGPRRAPFEVIGIAADAKYRSLVGDAPMLMYIPALWNYAGRTRVVARTAGDPAGMVKEIERAIHQVDANIPVYGEETMSSHRAGSLWQQRMAAVWIGTFSGLALVLAVVGLYGVVAQSVAQRTREAGIRIALGAAPGVVARMVVGEGMRLAGIGLAIGVPAAVAIDRVMGRMVAGLGGADFASSVVVAGLLGGVMAVTCSIPARRASRVDPMVALRCE
jgi:predicted permease